MMNLSNELAGLQANLEYAVGMVRSLSRDNAGRTVLQHSNLASDICLRLDMVKDYLSIAQKRIEELEGTLRHSYRDDVESVLRSLDI